MKRFLAVVLALVLALSCCAVAEDASYSQGKTLFAAQNFDAAISAFKAAGSYGDAADYVDYINVIKLGLDGLYSPAVSTIGNLYSGLDDADKYQTYFTALAEIEDGDYDTATTLLNSIDGFYNTDALKNKISELYHQSQLDDAAASLAAGDWAAAIAKYTALGETEMVKETYYQKAESLYAAGSFSAAADVYASIIGYKDAVEKLSRMEAIEGITAEFTVGNTVTFGSYVKNGTVSGNSWSGEKEDLKWIVLAVEDGKALLITRDIIDSQIYAAAGEPSDSSSDDGGEEYDDISGDDQEDLDTTTYEAPDDESGDDEYSDIDTTDVTETYGSYVTWYSSYLRYWLNSYFFYDAFDESEQLLVATTTVTPEANPVYRNNSLGSVTYDKVFVLSKSELETYFKSNKARLAKVTQYASRMRGAGSNSEGYGWYWVRNPGKDYFYALTCLRDGSVGTDGYPCNTTYIGVRPAIWVTLY